MVMEIVIFYGPRVVGTKHYTEKENYYYNFFYQGKTPGGSEITEFLQKLCLIVHPTLAGHHHAEKHITAKV